jgi:hypothetical protein
MDYKFTISKPDNNNKSFIGLLIYKDKHASSSTSNIASLGIHEAFSATGFLLIGTELLWPSSTEIYITIIIISDNCTISINRWTEDFSRAPLRTWRRNARVNTTVDIKTCMIWG